MNLEEKSREISKYLKEYAEHLKNSQVEIAKDIEETTEVLKEASAKGDRSENAEFTAATEKLSQLNARYKGIMLQLRDLGGIEDEEYENIGMIVLYSTIRLRNVDSNEEFVIRLYPGEISRVEWGIISTNSPIGRQVWFKGKGDTFTVENRDTGEPIMYEIIDFV